MKYNFFCIFKGPPGAAGQIGEAGKDGADVSSIANFNLHVC